MNAKTTLSVTEARKKFFEIVNDVADTNNSYVFSQNGVPKAILISPDEYSGWEETLEIMADRELYEDLKRHNRNKGKYTPEPGDITLEELLIEGKMQLNDSSELKYVPTNSKKKRTKKSKKD